MQYAVRPKQPPRCVPSGSHEWAQTGGPGPYSTMANTQTAADSMEHVAPLVSIFNDVIGPVMRGPSSSHSAASVRIGLLLHDLCQGPPDEVHVEYDSQGSLATTHESQGSDMGLFAGLLGWEADDPRLPGSAEALLARGTTVDITKPLLNDPHPNTYRIRVVRNAAAGVSAQEHEMIALSTGGGMIHVTSLNGRAVSLYGDAETTAVTIGDNPDPIAAALRSTEHVHSVAVAPGNPSIVLASSSSVLSGEALDLLDAHAEVAMIRQLRRVLPVASAPDTVVPFSCAADMQPTDALASQPLSDWAIAYESARGSIAAAEVLGQARRMLDVMRRSVDTGLAGTEYADRMLGWQSGNFQQMAAAGKLLDGGLLNRMIPYVTALMEAKSAMEVIVAAPTAGACATFPGALLAAIDELDSSEEAAERALLTGGLIGVFIANGSSFAAEVGGCQAETGAGAAMAAAALVELAGGTAAQSLSAASQTLQNVLGLICDPVANRVEAPCLGRNVAGAANALSCANMALAGYDHLIPLDEVIETHRQVSELMARELRCTGLGGLSQTPTAKRIELDLMRHRSATS